MRYLSVNLEQLSTTYLNFKRNTIIINSYKRKILTKYILQWF